MSESEKAYVFKYIVKKRILIEEGYILAPDYASAEKILNKKKQQYPYFRVSLICDATNVPGATPLCDGIAVKIVH